MNLFDQVLKKYNLQDSPSLKRLKLSTLQVNLGDLCNQSCSHCHVNASPSGKKIMSKKTIDNIIQFLVINNVSVLDLTGGAPEMNSHFEYFLNEAVDLVDEIIVRSNLTVIIDKKSKNLIEIFKRYNVHVISSLPCYLEYNVDIVRGKNVFDKSIQALKMLNSVGYGKQRTLLLDLVYNPSGPSLPPAQSKLEVAYRSKLESDYGIEFNRLIVIINSPIARFKDHLIKNEQFDEYSNLLIKNFNPRTLDKIMCRTYVSVGYDGKLFDCDFNQALGLSLKDDKRILITIDKLKSDNLVGMDINFSDHCLSCTAGSGSSCQGEIE